MANKNTIEPRTIEDTVECIEALAEIVKKNDLGKLKINTETYEIVIEGRPCPPPMPAPMPMMGVPAPTAAPAQNAPAQAAPAAEAAVSGNIITSPIVGTFYASPSPEKPAFVKVGDAVNAGDVVCIIESMKLMNEIVAETDGQIVEICAQNGQVVDFGCPLFRIK